MLSNRVLESINWNAEKFKSVVPFGKGVKIRGCALRGGAVTLNSRKYLREELLKSARTFVGKPICVNHDFKRICGNIEWMEYDPRDDEMNYLGVVNQEPWASMIKNGDSDIKGVSVDGNYLSLSCSDCGKEFYSEDDFKSHKVHEHLKSVANAEPFGLIGKGLALVVSPEQPGYQQTSIQVLEMEAAANRLAEIVERDPKYRLRPRDQEPLAAKPEPEPLKPLAVRERVLNGAVVHDVDPYWDPFSGKPPTSEEYWTHPVSGDRRFKSRDELVLDVERILLAASEVRDGGIPASVPSEERMVLVSEGESTALAGGGTVHHVSDGHTPVEAKGASPYEGLDSPLEILEKIQAVGDPAARMALETLNTAYHDFKVQKIAEVEKLTVENQALRDQIIELKTRENVVSESVTPQIEKLLKEKRDLVDQLAKAENEAERLRSKPQFKGVNRVAGMNRVDEPIQDPFKKEVTKK